MPQLLAFLPCDKVVVEEGTKNITISSILETIHVVIPNGLPPPPQQTYIPMNWAIYQLWQKEPGDAGAFETRVVLCAPDGQELNEQAVQRFEFLDGEKTRTQVIMKVTGFPIWTPGLCQLKLSLKRQGQQSFQDVVSLGMLLKHEQRQTAP